MPEARTISADKPFSWKAHFLQWEWILFLIFILVQVVNSYLSPYYLDFENLIYITMSFLDKAFIVLPMVFVIIMGEIDISVGSTVALSAVIMGVSYQAGVPMEAAIFICLLVGLVCGCINGIILTRFKELAPMIVTLSTMIIYRGIALIILEDKAVGKFPAWFQEFGNGYFGPVPIILICFACCAVVYGVLLHKTTFGRQVYAIGSNPTASLFSGVPVARVRIIVYSLLGLMSGVAAIFLTSRMSSTRPNVATGYELDVIAMTVLGGISTSGGKGRMIGAVISIFTVSYLRYGLGLRNVPAEYLMIIVGLMLIGAVMIPNIRTMYVEYADQRKKRAKR